jgi:hypothetical protein
VCAPHSHFADLKGETQPTNGDLTIDPYCFRYELLAPVFQAVGHDVFLGVKQIRTEFLHILSQMIEFVNLIGLDSDTTKNRRSIFPTLALKAIGWEKLWDISIARTEAMCYTFVTGRLPLEKALDENA